jgi:hypothetical protein
MNEKQVDASFEHLKQATILLVFDHARAGNGFFKRIFDQHPEVLCLTKGGYIYGQIVQLLGNRESMPGIEAYEWALSDGNINWIVRELTPESEAQMISVGDDPRFKLDREIVKNVLNELFLTRERVDRKEIFSSLYYAYALGIGRDVSRVKYLLMDAAPHNDKRNGEEMNHALFQAVLTDRVRVVHLVRDPRASFASIRHQYVNQFGNMYPIKSTKIWGTVYCNCIWLWILWYTTRGSFAMKSLENMTEEKNFCVVRNEDLNLNFEPTMKILTCWLGVEWYEPWSSSKYIPTSGGITHKGVSAYSSYYIPDNDGPFENDPDDRSRFAAPNLMVTERWKKRLLRREVALIEDIHFEEMKDLGYEPLYLKDSRNRVGTVLRILFPWAGEIPTRLQWWKSTKRKNMERKILFLLVFPFTYILSRLIFLMVYLSGKMNPR